MPLQDTSADADEFSTLEDIIDFSNEGINGGSVNQISPQPCSNSTITTSCTRLGNERFALEFQKEQLPALRGTSLDSDVYFEGLGVPWNEIPELGWLSGNDFVNECSFSSLADIDTTDLDIIQVKDRDDQIKNRFQSGSPISVLECSKEEVATSNQYIVNKGGASTLSHVPGRVRSKRKRSEACPWNRRILACNQSEADALSSTSLIRSCNSSASSYDRNAFFHDDYYEEAEAHASMHPRVIKERIKLNSSKAKSSSTLAASNHQAKLSAKKAESVQKIRSFKATTAPSATTDYYDYYDDDINDRSRVSMRKCSHCGSQTTPQWRAGPMGPKTLCNACGVRYKSGRLLPEYRPAASPTFQEALHSNSHRRVLEMHMSKKLAAGAGADRVSVAAPPSLLGTTGHQLSIIGHHACAQHTASI